MTDAYFHEDDFGQVEILPLDAARWCRAEMARIGDFADAHLAPGGLGYTAMYVRGEEPAKLRDLGLALDAVEACIGPALRRAHTVLTGYSTLREPCARTRGYVLADYAALYVGWDEHGYVEQIFYVDGVVPDALRAPFVDALLAMGVLARLVLVDWNQSVIVDLSDAAAVRAWVTAR